MNSNYYIIVIIIMYQCDMIRGTGTGAGTGKGMRYAICEDGIRVNKHPAEIHSFAVAN